MSDLYTKTNYIAPYDYIISSIIREYDISKANINVLKKYNAISDELYTYLYNSNRMTRQVTIGKLMKEQPELVNILKDGICEARRAFFEYNNIQDYEVLSIKNDAVYLINKEAIVTNCDGINFALKSIYTSYYKIKNKEYYYYLNRATEEELLDVKGMSKDKQCIHTGYFIEFLNTLFYSIQSDDITDSLEILNGFYNSYINLQLPIEYYRRFDGDSRFDIRSNNLFNSFKADFLPESAKDVVDISYNLTILMELQKIISGIYFQRNKNI